ncbi:MAG: class I SAM-dependent methyltransferase [Desulfobaccales bacterium]
MSALAWTHTECLFCRQAADKVLYPQRLTPESLTGYAFSARRLRRREHYRIVTCERCGLVRSDPILDDASLARLYAQSTFLFSEEVAYAAQTYAELFLELRTKFAGDRPIRRLVEIGCSTGFFLERVLDMGVTEVLGFEPSRDCLTHAGKRMRPHILNDTFRPDLLGGRTFDVACAFHVLDHLPRPDETLRDMASLIDPGGFLLLACHDVQAWTAKLLGDHSPIFDLEHIYLFSRDTLVRLVEQTGLTVLHCGSLTNRYPMGYWLRMAPGGGKLARLLTSSLRQLPVRLAAGNLYLVARKDAGT